MVFWEALIILLLILLNGFFAMSELAVVSARRVRLQQMAKTGSGGARAALELAADPGRFLSTVQVGITLIGILAGAYGGAALAQPLAEALADIPLIGTSAPTVAIGIVVLCITFLSLIVGELVPKRIALSRAEPIAALVARPMRLLAAAGAPVVWLLGKSTEVLLRLLGIRQTHGHVVTEEEIRSMVDEGTTAGVIEPAEREMIEGVLRLADRPVRAIMTPRPDVVWLDAAARPEVNAARIAAAGHSRYPVGRGTIDELLGIVETKDLVDHMSRGRPLDLQACLRQPLVVHDGTTALRLLELFRTSPVHVAMVVDEYGGLEGLVTPTDILSAIAGEMSEAGDEEAPQAVQRDDGSWLIDGRMPVDRVEALLGTGGLRGDDDDFHTLAGFVLWRLGHLPKTGESFTWLGIRFEVVDMDRRRIDQILIVPPAAAPESAAAGSKGRHGDA